MIKQLTDIFFYIFILTLITSCGTREFLGFEEKKVKLEGKRFPVLKEVSRKNIKSSETIKIKLTEKVVNKEWKQSYNSPSHASIHFSSDTYFKKIVRLTSGKGENKVSKILSQPTVKNNIIFFMDGQSNVISFDLVKNRTNWKYSAILANEENYNMGGGIAIYENSVIINTPYGEVISLDVNKGAVNWRNNFASPLRSAPTIYNNKVLSLTVDNKLLVLDAKNGKLVWEHEGIFNNTTIVSTPKVAVDDNIIIAPYSNGEFYGLNYSNGLVLWKDSFVEAESNDISNAFTDIDANPVIIGNYLIITSAIGKTIALDKRNGKRLWVNDISSTQTPVVNGNSIFIINNNRELINMDLSSGNIRWSVVVDKSTTKNYENAWYSPILVNNKLLLVGGKNEMLIINPYTGYIEKNMGLPGSPASSPFVVNNKLYLKLKNSDILTIE